MGKVTRRRYAADFKEKVALEVTIAFALNAIVVTLIPVLIARDVPAMVRVYGPDTPARRILACLYLTIALASITGLVLAHGLGRVGEAEAIGRTLFPLQIAYKLMTWPAVGLRNPVVISNLAIVILLVAALASMGF